MFYTLIRISKVKFKATAVLKPVKQDRQVCGC